MARVLPFDGWYNGNVDAMMANGTYADFRDVLVEKVRLGKLPQEYLDRYDKEWETISINEKLNRRALVVDESTPKPKVLKTTQGEVLVMLAEPSDGNNLKKQREKAKVKPPVKRAKGALTDDNNPLLKEAAAAESPTN